MNEFRHGTTTGWNRHKSDGERPCDACYAAKQAYDHRRRSAPEQTIKSRRAAKAQSIALRRLKDLHPGLYRLFYTEAKQILEAEEVR